MGKVQTLDWATGLEYWTDTFCCNMGMSDLPYMYVQSLRAVGINHECPCYKYYVTLSRLLPIRV